MNFITEVTDFSKGYFWGLVSFPVYYYIAKHMGYQIYVDAKTLWLNFFHKASDTVQTEVNKVIP